MGSRPQFTLIALRELQARFRETALRQANSQPLLGPEFPSIAIAPLQMLALLDRMELLEDLRRALVERLAALAPDDDQTF